jgi:hypothetical protein
MNKAKRKAIWLRPDQVDLLRTLLAHHVNAIGDGEGIGIEGRLLKLCGRRIKEIAASLPPAEPKVEIVTGKPRP